MTHTLSTGVWQTPGGHAATMTYRDGTSDWNTISACLLNPMGPTGDEYHMPSGLSGWGLDVGAHIGSVAVGLLLDNPDMRMVAIEGVPPNVDLIRQNLAQNGLTDRCTVLHGAAWDGRGTLDIEYGYTGSEVAEVHAFIGSITPWMDAPGDKVSSTVPIVNLAHAIRLTGGEGFVWVKTDCEGAEFHFFKGAGMKKLGVIEGEWHQRDGTPEQFAEQLSKTHVVDWGQGIGGGSFKAVPR